MYLPIVHLVDSYILSMEVMLGEFLGQDEMRIFFWPGIQQQFWPYPQVRIVSAVTVVEFLTLVYFDPASMLVCIAAPFNCLMKQFTP